MERGRKKNILKKCNSITRIIRLAEMKWDVISFHTLRCRCAPLLRTSETTPLNRKFYLASSTVPMIRIDVSALHSTHLFRARNRDDSVSFPTGRAPCRVLCRRGRPNRFEDVINRTSLAAVATRRNYNIRAGRGVLFDGHILHRSFTFSSICCVDTG